MVLEMHINIANDIFEIFYELLFLLMMCQLTWKAVALVNYKLQNIFMIPKKTI